MPHKDDAYNEVDSLEFAWMAIVDLWERRTLTGPGDPVYDSFFAKSGGKFGRLCVYPPDGPDGRVGAVDAATGSIAGASEDVSGAPYEAAPAYGGLWLQTSRRRHMVEVLHVDGCEGRFVRLSGISRRNARVVASSALHAAGACVVDVALKLRAQLDGVLPSTGASYRAANEAERVEKLSHGRLDTADEIAVQADMDAHAAAFVAAGVAEAAQSAPSAVVETASATAGLDDVHAKALRLCGLRVRFLQVVLRRTWLGLARHRLDSDGALRPHAAASYPLPLRALVGIRLPEMGTYESRLFAEAAPAVCGLLRRSPHFGDPSKATGDSFRLWATAALALVTFDPSVSLHLAGAPPSADDDRLLGVVLMDSLCLLDDRHVGDAEDASRRSVDRLVAQLIRWRAQHIAGDRPPVMSSRYGTLSLMQWISLARAWLGGGGFVAAPRGYDRRSVEAWLRGWRGCHIAGHRVMMVRRVLTVWGVVRGVDGRPVLEDLEVPVKVGELGPGKLLRDAAGAVNALEATAIVTALRSLLPGLLMRELGVMLEDEADRGESDHRLALSTFQKEIALRYDSMLTHDAVEHILCHVLRFASSTGLGLAYGRVARRQAHRGAHFPAPSAAHSVYEVCAAGLMRLVIIDRERVDVEDAARLLAHARQGLHAS